MGAPAKKKLTKQQIKAIEKMVADGATRGSIMLWLGWSSATFYRQIEKDEGLKKAIEVGKAQDFQIMTNLMRVKAMDGSFPHLAGYMRVIHQTDITAGDGITGKGGSQIVVHLNLGLPQGQTIEGEVVKELTQD